MKILDVLYLAGLGHSISFLFEAPFAIELHHLFSIIECSHEEKKTAYNSSSPAFAMVTVENSHSFWIPSQIMRNFITNEKESIKGWSFVVFPFVANHILENSLVYAPSADVYS